MIFSPGQTRGVVRSALLLCLLMTAVATIHAQDESGTSDADEEQYSGEGFSLQGGSGFFNVLSPILIRPGNILAGFSYHTEFGDRARSAPPVSIGYGIAKFSEAYVAFEPRSLGSGSEENEVLVGVKMLGLSVGDLVLGAGIAYRNVDVTADGTYAGRYMHYGAQLLAGYHFDGGLRFLGNAGYSLADGDNEFTADYVSLGAGLSLPLQSSLLLITDASARLLSSGLNIVHGTAGARYYLFDHVQVNAGMQFNSYGDGFHVGVMLGVGFSSEILRTSLEGDAGGEDFPELPSLVALDGNGTDAVEAESGNVPELPPLEQLEAKDEAPEVDTKDAAEETVPELPSLEELESREKEETEEESGEKKKTETTPPGLESNSALQ